MLLPCEGLMLLPLYDNFKLADVMPFDCGMSFVLFIMADVIAMALSFWLMLLPMCDVWQMF